MHCVLISGDPSSILIRRSVEVLGYQSNQREVVILFALYLDKKREEPETLSVLHRGNVDLWFRAPWPPPRHPFEVAATHRTRETADGILSRVYGPYFKEAVDGELRLHAGLGFGDRKYSVKRSTRVQPFTPPSLDPPALESMDSGARVVPVGGFISADKYVPFTIWNIGPFEGAGPRILSFLMRISKSNYDVLVGQQGYFTIDGPERLLSRIIHGDLTTQAYRLDRSLTDRILPFRTSMLFSAAYDVIVLGDPIASQTAVHMLNGAEIGQIQPDRHHRRFITQTPHFSITLRFENSRRVQHRRRSAMQKMRRRSATAR